ncbi:sugar ABC transporter permease [Lachnospiraceae bacterium]|nr:sugar ABC transporter permease [Lachnospiraceae bacterium]
MAAKKIYPTWFVTGALLFYVVLFFLPGIMGIGYSFTDWNAYSPEVNFVGLENYKNIFYANSNYGTFIKNTFVFTLVSSISKTTLGIALAMLLTSKKIWGKNVHRMLIFLPQVMSFLIIGLVFKNLFHPSRGFINITLNAIGFDFLAQNWLGDLDFAFKSVLAVDAWKGSGYVMMVVIAGLNAISPTYYEAASIDGASFIEKFKYITLPLLKPVIMNVTVLNITYGFRVFDLVYSLTNGGPGNATGVINTAVYSEFSKGNYAMGTTLSSLLFIFIMSISYFILKVMNRGEVEQ